MDAINLKPLNGPLFYLRFIYDVYDEKTFNKVGYFHHARRKEDYSKEKLINLIKVIEWALTHPEYDFHVFGYKHLSNQDIYYYLSEFYKRLMIVLEERNLVE